MKIKAILFSVAITTALFISDNVFAQDGGGNGAFAKGDNVINVGIGIGGEYSYWGNGYSVSPNIVASYENGTFGNIGPGTISLGGLISYKGISYDWVDGRSNYNYSEKWNYWIIGFRGAYHLNVPSAPKFDPYAGIMLGYYIVGHTFSSNDPYYNQPGDPGYYYYNNGYPSYIGFSMFIGARYYLGSKVGLWAELGYGYTTLALGVSFKF
jgi:hypothetical protein